VIGLISEQTGIENLNINEDTKLEEDLAGLDTVHFMKKFFTEFQIDNHKRL
jgi:hypothetical protein